MSITKLSWSDSQHTSWAVSACHTCRVNKAVLAQKLTVLFDLNLFCGFRWKGHSAQRSHKSQTEKQKRPLKQQEDSSSSASVLLPALLSSVCSTTRRLNTQDWSLSECFSWSLNATEVQLQPEHLESQRLQGDQQADKGKYRQPSIIMKMSEYERK